MAISGRRTSVPSVEFTKVARISLAVIELIKDSDRRGRFPELLEEASGRMGERKAQLSAIIPVTGQGALPGVEIVQ
jgi:hypothetical protein